MKNPIVGCVLGAWVGLAIIAAAQDKAGSSVTVEGQVVCSSCWFEADRTTTPYGNEGDLKCAVDCAKGGMQQAIAVAEKNGFTLYLLEPGKLKRDRRDWLDYIAKRVKASGTVRTEGNKHYLKVDSIEISKTGSDRSKYNE